MSKNEKLFFETISVNFINSNDYEFCHFKINNCFSGEIHISSENCELLSLSEGQYTKVKVNNGGYLITSNVKPGPRTETVGYNIISSDPDGLMKAVNDLKKYRSYNWLSISQDAECITKAVIIHRDDYMPKSIMIDTYNGLIAGITDRAYVLGLDKTKHVLRHITDLHNEFDMEIPYQIHIGETEFGASTDASIMMRNNICTKVQDTSTNSTNYSWDNWREGFLQSLIGKSIDEIKEMCNHYFDDFVDEYRRPRVIIK
jgi:hypothetical protein